MLFSTKIVNDRINVCRLGFNWITELTRSSKVPGPAIMITAAFIGPGTILIASQAGAKHGFALLWVVFFATVTTIVLQEMAGRLGIVTGSGLGQAITGAFANVWLKTGLVSLILLAVLVGNSAYQTGNLLGAQAGFEPFIFNQSTSPAIRLADEPRILGHPISDNPANKQTEQTEMPLYSSAPITAKQGHWLVVLTSLLAGVIILIGKFDWLRKILTFLVGLMSLMFVFAAVLSQPHPWELVIGLIPSFPPNSAPLILGLIGTTVVPYNLFLHASAAANRWPESKVKKTIDKEQAIRDSLKDTIVAVSVGGLVTAGILITAAMAFHPSKNAMLSTVVDFQRVGEISHQLHPILGDWATFCFGIGLFAAGFTSAITAPVAAGLATAGCFGWQNQLADWRVKVTALGVLICGCLLAICFGKAPQQAILMAQMANGLILPLLAIMLFILANRLKIMNRFTNSGLHNISAVIVILVVLILATNQLIVAAKKLW